MPDALPEPTLIDVAEALLRRGFCVLPGFLSSDLRAAFEADYDAGSSSQNNAYSLGLPSAQSLARLRPQLEELVAAFGGSAEFRPNRIGGGVFFAIRNGIDFGWHQDHESFFVNQTHRHYLNAYIAVRKPERARSNLCLVPADRFAAAAPELWSKLEWGGAATYREAAGRRFISDDWRGGEVGDLDFPIEDIAETPELDAGDALLMRGDLFHRTQDTDTDRVALSVRVAGDTHTVSRSHFLTSCDVKAWFLAQNAPMYEAIDAVFRETETLALSDLLERAYRLRAS